MLGAQVNVTGTVNVFEAAKRHGLGTPIAYASSAAVYDEHGAGRAEHALRRLQARERGHGADLRRRRRRREHRAAAVHRLRAGPRPGHDRRPDAGDRRPRCAASRTGSPSAAGRSSTTRRDVARAFVQAARSRAGRRAGVQPRRAGDGDRRLRRRWSRRRCPARRSRSTTTPLPFPDELPEPWFDSPLTPLEQGVRETVEALAKRRIVAATATGKGGDAWPRCAAATSSSST